MSEPAQNHHSIVHVETTPEQRAANRHRRAQSDRNVDYWNEHCRELTDRYLHRFLVIYNGGEMRDFPDAISMNDFVRSLPREQGNAAMRQYVDYAVPYWSYLVTQ
ncbi:MAG: hypothetical protein F4W96_11560 [Chloroflexi bacterium]|nr:hypothetical protein [Chloroflexota bacterium]